MRNRDLDPADGNQHAERNHHRSKTRRVGARIGEQALLPKRCCVIRASAFRCDVLENLVALAGFYIVLQDCFLDGTRNGTERIGFFCFQLFAIGNKQRTIQ